MNPHSVFGGYLACALWSSTDESDETGGLPLDWNYTSDDIAPETLETMREDCKNFCEANAKDLEESGLDDDQIGHDLWLTRNHHGAGFWDKALGDVGERLTEAAQALGEVWLYIGDDGKIYQG